MVPVIMVGMNNPLQVIDDKYLEMAVKIVTAVASGPAGQDLVKTPASGTALIRALAFELRGLHKGDFANPDSLRT
jgi:hypothetical protein